MQRVGVALAADGAAEYFATLDRVNQAGAALISATQSLVAALNRYDDQAGKAGQATAELVADTKPAEQAFHQLDMFAGDAGESVLGVGKDASKAAGGVDGLGDAADRAGEESKGLGDDAEEGARGLSFMEQAAVGAARKLGELAVEGAAAAAQAIVDFAKDGIKAAGDFEGGMNTFAATVGQELDTSGLHLDDFKQLFISLGRDLPVSTAEVQQAAIEMSKGGIDPATIAAGGLKQALQFAAASGLGLADAAQISAKILQGWVPLAASAADKTAFFSSSTDLLTKATTAAATNVDQLSLGLFNVQGAAHSTGVSFNDTVTTLALLTPAFNSSASAGDSMKNMLLSLIPKSSAAASAMADLGLLTKNGTSAFYDAQGSFIGMRATAEKLQKALGGLSEAQRTEALRTIFGNDALNAANVLVQAGAKGYDDITKKIALQNGVAEQAAKKQEGFNVALDNMGGSLEALQITIFSAALPALTSLVNLVAKGINVITDYAAATLEGKTALAGIASFIESSAIPVITGLTAGVAAWAIVQAVQATPAVLASIPAIIAQTTAFIANAAAVTAALAPYALIAVAVAGIAVAYKGLQDQLASVTDRVLAGSQAWQASVQALANYDAASEEAKAAAQGQADMLRSLQTEQRGAIEQYALHTAAYQQFGIASGQTAESLEAERLAINARGDAIIAGTTALNDQVQAEIKTQAASLTATAALEDMRSGTEQMGDQVSLTAEEMEKFAQKIVDIRDKGGAALQGYATTQSEFLDGVESRQAEHAAQIEELERKKQDATTAEQKQGIDDQIKQVNDSYRDQETAAAKSYARQQAEQRQHLGQMLLDYTVTQAQLGNISMDKASQITGALEKEYGLQKSSVASTFTAMAASIDQFAHSSNQDVSTLTATLHDQQRQAADTQHAMDNYAKTYEAEAVSNFLDAKSDADDYIESLESIPSRVQSTMLLPDIDDRDREIRTIRDHINDIPETKKVIIDVEYREHGAPTSGRASGGPMTAMQPYLVGERGPELIIPDRNSYVLNASETRRAMASPLVGSGGATNYYGPSYTIAVDARGSNLTEAHITQAVQRGLRAEGNEADIRIRTG